jgi:hypothetical protein
VTLRDNLLPTFQGVRGKIQGFGLRQNALAIKTLIHDGRPGLPETTISETVLTLTPTPKIREISSREVASSGGHYELGDLKVTKITPQHTKNAVTAGYTPEEIRPQPSLVDGQHLEVIYAITGPTAGDYTLVDSDFSKNFGYELTLRRRITTP